MTAPRMSPEETIRYAESRLGDVERHVEGGATAQYVLRHLSGVIADLEKALRSAEREAADEARAAFPVDEIEALLRAGFVTEGGCDGTGSGIPEFAASCIGCRAVRVLKALGRWP